MEEIQSENPMGDFQTFIEAVEDGNLEEARSSFQIDFLERIKDDKYKRRPIHLACRYGHREIVKFLLENKCNVECEDNEKKRPIHYACKKGRLDILKILIQSNCEIDCQNIDGLTPMDIAKECKNKSCFNYLTVVLKRNKIFNSIRRNDVHAFDELYSPSNLVMEDDETRFSLLEVAMESKANGIIDYILKKLVTAEDISTLKNYSKGSCRPDTVKILQECLLYRSIRCHDADGFHLSGLAKTINGQRKLGKSSYLETAAKYDCKPFIPLLLKKTVYNEEEWTKAKDLANLKGNSEIAQAISNRIFLQRKRTDKNFTLLHSAVCENDPDMVKYILEKNLVNPNSNNEVVGTALALAHMMCYGECIEVLEKFKVDVNTQNKYSQSPLHEAIASGMIDHCPYLISGSEEIDKPGYMGFTGLQCAVIEGCEELCEELLKKGADCIRYVEILQQSTIKKAVLQISKSENAVTLCQKIHQKLYPCLLKGLDSDKLKCADVQSVMTNEIIQLVIPHDDPKLLMSLFTKSNPTVQQSSIEDLLDHFASTNNVNDFDNLLNKFEVAAPKLFPNGETILTNLLKQKKPKYCKAIINCERNKKYIVLPNSLKETPFQIAIESELFDLTYSIILNCDNQSDLGFNWDNSLIPLFQKLSISSNYATDQELINVIKMIILRGGDIYKNTSEDTPIINLCTRYKEKIENYQKSLRPKELEEKTLCSICMDRQVNSVFDCGHNFCMDCALRLNLCAICNEPAINLKKLYLI